MKHSNPTSEVKSPEAEKYHCKECNKSFNSGKALGGHMSSAHVQSSKDYSHVCGVCAKSFPSQKSLYGHMRCHPDRDWRGMAPPSDPGPDCSNYNLDSFKTWPVKARRGRSGTVSSSDEEDEELISAGHQLLRLLKRLPGSGIQKEGIDCVHVPSEDSFVLDENHTLEANIKAETVVVVGPTEADHDIPSRDCKRQRASNDLANHTTCPRLPRRDRAEKHVCKKVFPSHQALGGHKSSHNKFTMNIINTEDTSAKNSNTGNNIIIRDTKPKGEIMGTSNNSTVVGVKNAMESDQQQPPPSGDNDNKMHICPICKRGFPTARALGGHKKIHKNKGGDDDDGGEEKVVSVRDFDLNTVPNDENAAAAATGTGTGTGDASHMI